MEPNSSFDLKLAQSITDYLNGELLKKIREDTDEKYKVEDAKQTGE